MQKFSLEIQLQCPMDRSIMSTLLIIQCKQLVQCTSLIIITFEYWFCVIWMFNSIYEMHNLIQRCVSIEKWRLESFCFLHCSAQWKIQDYKFIWYEYWYLCGKSHMHLLIPILGLYNIYIVHQAIQKTLVLLWWFRH